MARLDAIGLTRLIGATGDSPLPAWQAMLALWQLPADSITVDPAGPCATGANPEIHCVQGNASLDTLLALDRPVLLRLHDAGADAWALLLGADARRARIRIGERTLDIDRVQLMARWNGRYASLWRGPAMLASAPRLDTSGPAVDWVRQQVAAGCQRSCRDALRRHPARRCHHPATGARTACGRHRRTVDVDVTGQRIAWPTAVARTGLSRCH